MNRQIASVDCLYDEATGEVFVLEVNYNPQLVTVETFKDVRIKAFLDNLNSIA
jgi:D-alanine-D-alanine ligase-like ATP-grasp enzyme